MTSSTEATTTVADPAGTRDSMEQRMATPTPWISGSPVGISSQPASFANRSSVGPANSAARMVAKGEAKLLRNGRSRNLGLHGG